MERLGPGSTFAERYEVLRCIGVGGMGAVYEVLHTATRRRRALKVLHPGLVANGEARQRFALEACITASVESEHIVDVFDAGVDEATGAPFIVMELLKGYSLGDRLERKQRFSVSEVLEVLGQAARALEKTHAAGVVHRDLKPDNLFVVERPDGLFHVKILDFGIAKAVASGASRSTINIGTPVYMAPEQLEGGFLGPQADVFALGHIAYEILTGEHYWEQELRNSPSTMVLMRIIDRGYPEPASIRAGRLGVEVGPMFDAWFLRATARSPAERYPTPTALVDAFADAVGQPQFTPTLVMPMSAELLEAMVRLPGAATAAVTSQRVEARPAPHVAAAGKQTGGARAWHMDTPRPSKRVSRLAAAGLAMAGAAAVTAAVGVFVLRAHPKLGVGDAASSVGPGVTGSAPVAAEESGAVGVTPAPNETASAAGSALAAPSASSAASASAKAKRPPAPTKPQAPRPVQDRTCATDPRRCR